MAILGLMAESRDEAIHLSWEFFRNDLRTRYDLEFRVKAGRGEREQAWGGRQVVDRMAYTYTLENLTNGTTYEVRLREIEVVDSGGLAPVTLTGPWVEAEAEAGAAPGAPSIALGESNRQGIVLQWRRGQPGGAAPSGWQIQVQLSPDNTGWEDEVLLETGALRSRLLRVDDEFWRVRIRERATFRDGSALWGPYKEMEVSPLELLGRTSYATGNWTYRTTYGEVKIFWENAGSGTPVAIRVWRREADRFPQAWTMVELPGDATEHRATGLRDDTIYEFLIQPFGSSSIAGSVGAIRLRPGVGRPPARPVNLAVHRDAGGRSDEELATWGYPADQGTSSITGFRLEWRTTDGDQPGAWQGQDVTNVQDYRPNAGLFGPSRTGFVIFGPFFGGRTYEVRVAAVNATGRGEWSESVMTTEAAERPGVPRNVVLAQHASGLALRWEAEDNAAAHGVTGYEVQGVIQDPDAPDPWGEIIPLAADVFEHEWLDLETGLTYYARVRSVSAAGESAWVQAGPVEAPFTAIAPERVQAAVENGFVAVSWLLPPVTGSQPIIGWQIQSRADGGDWGPETYTASGGDVRSFVIRDIGFGADYDFRVRAIHDNEIGFGAWGETSRQLFVGRVAGPPLNLAGASAPLAVDLTWDAPADLGSPPLVRYDVDHRVSHGADVRWARESTTGAETSHRVRNLLLGEAYEFRVRGVASRSHVGVWSATIVASPGLPPPGPVIGFTATPSGDGVALAWVDAPQGADNVRIRWRRTGETGWPNRTEIAADALGWFFGPRSGALGNQSYDFEAAGENDGGVGDAVEASATVAWTPPAPVVSAVGGTDSVVLSWARQIDPTGSPFDGAYVVQWARRGAMFGTTDQLTTGAAHRQATITGLTEGVEYQFRVRANVAGAAWSDVVVAGPSTAPVAPEVPRNVRVVGVAAGRVNVRWEAPAHVGTAPVAAYDVQWRARSQSFSPAREVSDAVALNHDVGGLDVGGTFFFRVRAKSADGYGAWSDEVAGVAALPAGPVVGLTATSGAGLVMLTWTAPSESGDPPGTEYEIEWRTPDISWGLARSIRMTETMARINGLLPGMYEFRVRLASVAPGPWEQVSATPLVEETGLTPATPVGQVRLRPLDAFIQAAAQASGARPWPTVIEDPADPEATLADDSGLVGTAPRVVYEQANADYVPTLAGQILSAALIRYEVQGRDYSLVDDVDRRLLAILAGREVERQSEFELFDDTRSVYRRTRLIRVPV